MWCRPLAVAPLALAHVKVNCDGFWSRKKGHWALLSTIYM